MRCCSDSPQAPSVATCSRASKTRPARRYGSASMRCALPASPSRLRRDAATGSNSRWTCSLPMRSARRCASPHARSWPRWKSPGRWIRPTANCCGGRRRCAVATCCWPNARAAVETAGAHGPRHWPRMCISRSRVVSKAQLARLGGLSLVAGIAACEALRASGSRKSAKWPNDLVVVEREGLRKLGGLLVEGGGEAAGAARAVIGLGLNVRMPVAAAGDIDQPWIDLASMASPRPRAMRSSRCRCRTCCRVAAVRR